MLFKNLINAGLKCVHMCVCIRGHTLIKNIFTENSIENFNKIINYTERQNGNKLLKKHPFIS